MGGASDLEGIARLKQESFEKEAGHLNIHAKPFPIATANTSLCHSSLSHTHGVRKLRERGESSALCHLPFISLLLGCEAELGFGARPAGCTKAFRQIAHTEIHSPRMPACFCGFELLCSGTEQETAQVNRGGWGSVTALLEETQSNARDRQGAGSSN